MLRLACATAAVAVTLPAAVDLAGAADLQGYVAPNRHGHLRIVLRPATAVLVPPHPPRNDCVPGYALNSVNVCKRHGELKVRCTPDGLCEPLPPDPLPYGIGPYERLNYENGEPLLPSFNY